MPAYAVSRICALAAEGMDCTLSSDIQLSAKPSLEVWLVENRPQYFILDLPGHVLA